jgi:Zn-finger nucleic acid-binding protein
MEAGTLNCPECGAAVSKDSAQCQYCHALLQTVACPKCMGMMFAGTKFCPHCGARAETIAQGQATKRLCPRCHVALTDVQVASTPLDECTHCGGLWIDVANFEHICSDTEASQAATGLQLPPPVPLDPHVRYLPCPQCTNLMSRMNYAGRSGVVINVCRPHGIWLDRNAMRQIIEFIRAGGLDRARKIETEELQEARQRSSFQPVEPGVPMLSDTFHDSFNSDDRVHLLRGIASLANHFLGEANRP